MEKAAHVAPYSRLGVSRPVRMCPQLGGRENQGMVPRQRPVKRGVARPWDKVNRRSTGDTPHI